MEVDRKGDCVTFGGTYSPLTVTPSVVHLGSLEGTGGYILKPSSMTACKYGISDATVEASVISSRVLKAFRTSSVRVLRTSGYLRS